MNSNFNNVECKIVANYCGVSSTGGSLILEPINSADIPYDIPAPANKPNKKGKKMSRYYDEYNDCYVDAPTSPVTDQRNYFKNRIATIRCEKDSELMTKFGLRDEDAPQNFEEFMARIQAGRYVFRKEEYKTNTPYWRDYIEWRDPSVKKDQKGYAAAWEAFEKEVTKTGDAVMALPADKAMEAVQALEAWVPNA